MIKKVTLSRLIFIGSAFAGFFGATAFAFGPPSVESNNEGLKRYKAEEYQEAFTGFADALARDPFNPIYHLNLGDSFFKGGDYPKAMAEYESVERNPKAAQELKFQALFNAGNASVEAKDIPRALQFYQKALSLKPDSLETKTNIELALKDEEKQKKSGDDKKDDKKGGSGDKDKKDNKKDDKGDSKNKDPKDQKDKKDPKDEKDQGKKPDANKDQPKPKPTPQGFKSPSLSENDVSRILEELKRQEQEIRARQYKENKKAPESQIEKDW